MVRKFKKKKPENETNSQNKKFIEEKYLNLNQINLFVCLFWDGRKMSVEIRFVDFCFDIK